MIDNYVNGIHGVQNIIEYLASEYISDVGHRQCGQKYFMASDLGIRTNELELVCSYLGIDLDNLD